jgi:hypothetical protein
MVEYSNSRADLSYKVPMKVELASIHFARMKIGAHNGLKIWSYSLQWIAFCIFFSFPHVVSSSVAFSILHILARLGAHNVRVPMAKSHHHY